MLTDLRAEPERAARRPGRRPVIAGWSAVAVVLLVLLVGFAVARTRHSESPVAPLPLPAAAPIVDPALRNCVVSPSGCGYPDATDTGVPASIVLKAVPSQVSAGPGWHWDS
ncbi:MAG: hypothetical protein ACR2N4_10490, partial [Jatrophihabitans sp.]